ncbi:hypothetical protein BHE74_00005557 [Ensete ventricosum]|nr:hypothetical protein BHE74_00005557 [Ensete ventricosum]RZR89755.1 hypothetical protein BHM03_00017534 [Ensete ventricosum]
MVGADEEGSIPSQEEEEEEEEEDGGDSEHETLAAMIRFVFRRVERGEWYILLYLTQFLLARLRRGEWHALVAFVWAAFGGGEGNDADADADRNAEEEEEEEEEELRGDTVEHEIDQDNIGITPAAALVVERLPIVVLSDEDAAKRNTSCAVCKDGIATAEAAMRLPCSHIYHAGCILPWLGIRNTCPVCRHELPTEDDDLISR